MELFEEKVGFNGKQVSDLDSCLLGLPPVAPYHIGYDFFAASIRELEQRGVKTTIMYPRLHVRSLPDLEDRMSYYSTVLGELSAIDPDFNRGNFQYRQDYWTELRQLLKKTPVKRTSKALPEEANRSLDYMLVVSQVLDSVHLEHDFVISGLPQRMVYMLGRDILPKQDKKPLLFLQLARDINGRKLKKSSLSTRINIHDSPTAVRQKLEKMGENQLRRVHEYSVKPYTESPGTAEVENVAEKLSERFDRMEEKLEEKGNMEWLDMESFS